MQDMTNIAEEGSIEAEASSQRTYPGLEWTDSEWFKLWLDLARNQTQHDHN